LGRREVTTALTMLALTGILVVGAVWGWRSLFAEVPGGGLTTAEPGPSCSTEQVKAGGKIRAKQIRVSVFNGGTRTGLAGDTLDALMERGFIGGDLGNAPSDVKVRGVQVWSTIENDPTARLVALQFGKDVEVRFSDEDLGPGVDVIVGDRYRSLAPAPTSIRVQDPIEFCVSMQPTDLAG